MPCLYQIAGNVIKYGGQYNQYVIGPCNDLAFTSFTHNLWRLSTGRYYVCVKNATDVNLWYSDTLGVTWVGPVVANTIALDGVFNVDSAVDSNGDVHVAWCAQRTSDGTRRIYYRKWSGTAFQGAAETLASGALSHTNMLNVGVAVNNNDQVLVVFRTMIGAQAWMYGTKPPFSTHVGFYPTTQFTYMSLVGRGANFDILYAFSGGNDRLEHHNYNNAGDAWSVVDADVFGINITQHPYWAFAEVNGTLWATAKIWTGSGGKMSTLFNTGSTWTTSRVDLDKGDYPSLGAFVRVPAAALWGDPEYKVHEVRWTGAAWSHTDVIPDAVDPATAPSGYYCPDVGQYKRVGAGLANQVIIVH